MAAAAAMVAAAMVAAVMAAAARSRLCPQAIAIDRYFPVPDASKVRYRQVAQAKHTRQDGGHAAEAQHGARRTHSVLSITHRVSRLHHKRIGAQLASD